MRPEKLHPNPPTLALMMSYEDLPGLKTLVTRDEKHELASESTLDVLWVLYDRVLKVDPEAPDDPNRDRFLLSKGHGPMAYYAVLAAKGFVPMDALPTFGRYDSILGQHPDHSLIPGVEVSSRPRRHQLFVLQRSRRRGTTSRARSEPRDQGAAADRLRCRTRVGGLQADRPHLRAVLGRAAVRAGQARLWPSRVGCDLRLRRGVLRCRGSRENAPGAGRTLPSCRRCRDGACTYRPPGLGRSDPAVDGCRKRTRLDPSRNVGQSQSHRLFERPYGGPARIRERRDCNCRRFDAGACSRSYDRP